MLKDKVMLVTGGSGAIGAAICEKAAGYGANIAFTWHSQKEEAQEIAKRLEQSGVRVFSSQVDATDGSSVEGFVTQAEEKLGQVDILVNNIGATQVMPFALIEEEDWDQAMAVNLKSMFLFSKACVRGMIRQKSGSIINLGSLAGERLLEVPVHYATAKAGVGGLTLSLAKEMERYNVRVNAVIPGLIEGGVGSNVSDRQLDKYREYCLAGRQGTPEEVAELVCFLASDRASYINAQSITIDGGL
jgi:3-oxoacyl-[acyl-carrier protein] reductase